MVKKGHNKDEWRCFVRMKVVRDWKVTGKVQIGYFGHYWLKERNMIKVRIMGERSGWLEEFLGNGWREVELGLNEGRMSMILDYRFGVRNEVFGFLWSICWRMFEFLGWKMKFGVWWRNVLSGAMKFLDWMDDEWKYVCELWLGFLGLIEE